MTTARELITNAFRDANVVPLGGTLSAANVAEGLSRLNQMMGTWRAKRWLVYQISELSLTSTGAQSYGIGPAQPFPVTTRPDRLEYAFVRFMNGTVPVDHPIEVYRSRQDYARIAAKTINGLPQSVYLQTGWPLGTLYFWPVPTANIYALHVGVKDALASFPTLDTVINLPPEYESALQMQLARRLAPLSRKQLSPDYLALAKDALAAIKILNHQMPLMEMPSNFPGASPRYNIYSDSTR